MSSSQPHPSPSETYLPADFIRALKKQLDNSRRMYAELPAIIEEEARRFDAAMVFAPPGFDPDAVGTQSDRSSYIFSRPDDATKEPQIESLRKSTPLEVPSTKKVSWRKAIQVLLESAEGGMQRQEVLHKARKQYDLPASHGEKSFYNSIAKLSSIGAVIKHGNLLFSSKVLEEMKAQGKLPAAPEVARRAGSSAEIVIKVLRENPAGLTGTQLREVLSGVPGAPKSLYQHGQYIYNVLAPMIVNGEVSKDDGTYRLRSPVMTGTDSRAPK